MLVWLSCDEIPQLKYGAVHTLSKQQKFPGPFAAFAASKAQWHNVVEEFQRLQTGSKELQQQCFG